MFFKKLYRKKETDASDLLTDIKEAAAWAADNLKASGYLADYSLDSVVDLDRFITQEGQESGVLRQEDRGIIFFAIGAYLGETLLNSYGGDWLVDDHDPQAELNIGVTLASGQVLQPVKACLNRFKSSQSVSLDQLVQSLEINLEHLALQDTSNQVE